MDLIQTSECGICGKKSATEIYLGLSMVTSVYPVTIIPPTLHTFSSIPQGRYTNIELKNAVK